MGFCLWGVFLYPWWRFCYSCPFQGTVVQSVPTVGKFLGFPNPWCKILQILCAILSKFARRIVSTCRKWCVLSNLARKNGISSDQLVHLGAKLCPNYGPSGTPVPTRAINCLACKSHQTLGRRFQQNSKKFGRVPNLFALTGDAGACGSPAMSN